MATAPQKFIDFPVDASIDNIQVTSTTVRNIYNALVNNIHGGINTDELLSGQIGGPAPMQDKGLWNVQLGWRSWDGNNYSPLVPVVGSVFGNVTLAGSATASRRQALQDKAGTIALLDDIVSARPTIFTESGAVKIDWKASSNFQVRLTSDSLLQMVHIDNSARVNIMVINQGTNYTVTWDDRIKWPSGISPTQPDADAGQSISGLYVIRNISGNLVGEFISVETFHLPTPPPPTTRGFGYPDPVFASPVNPYIYFQVKFGATEIAASSGASSSKIGTFAVTGVTNNLYVYYDFSAGKVVFKSGTNHTDVTQAVVADTYITIEAFIHELGGSVVATPRVNGTAFTNVSMGVPSGGDINAHLSEMRLGSQTAVITTLNRSVDDVRVGTTDWASGNAFSANFDDGNIAPPFTSTHPGASGVIALHAETAGNSLKFTDTVAEDVYVAKVW